jgi:hypothetical protein
MAIKTCLEEAIKKVEIERDRQAQVAKDRAMRERIIPFNAEIDKARDEAIAQRQNALNAELKAQQENFAKERQSFFEAAEKKKSENAEVVISSETAIVVAEYNRHISKLQAQLADIKE